MSKDTSMMKRGSERAEGIQQRPAVAPAVDVFENKDELLIVADMPGVVREHVNLHLEKGKLTLDARRDEAAEGNLLAAEFRAVDYRRTFLVPQGIDAEKISAELVHGVLRVHLPKAAALRPRQIKVTAAQG
jgi:HSP20 family protein